MATKKAAHKKAAHKTKTAKPKAQKKPVEIFIAKDGTVTQVTNVSRSGNAGIYWKSADRNLQWEVYFLCDPFDHSMLTSSTTGKTGKLHLHKRVAPGDFFDYHLVGPIRPKKDQVTISTVAEIRIDS